MHLIQLVPLSLMKIIMQMFYCQTRYHQKHHQKLESKRFIIIDIFVFILRVLTNGFICIKINIKLYNNLKYIYLLL
jgi:hypothetical protein